jgi:hypothetical protein
MERGCTAMLPVPLTDVAQFLLVARCRRIRRARSRKAN